MDNKKAKLESITGKVYCLCLLYYAQIYSCATSTTLWLKLIHQSISLELQQKYFSTQYGKFFGIHHAK